MPDQHGFGDNGTESARLGQSSQGDDQMDEQHEEVEHPGNANSTSKPTGFRPLWQFAMHNFHHERNHQGKDNVLLFPASSQDTVRAGPLQCRERLGGLLKYYECEAA